MGRIHVQVGNKGLGSEPIGKTVRPRSLAASCVSAFTSHRRVSKSKVSDRIRLLWLRFREEQALRLALAQRRRESRRLDLKRHA